MKKIFYLLNALMFITGLSIGAILADWEDSGEQPQEVIVQESEPKIVYEYVEVPKVTTVKEIEVLPRQIETQLKQYEKELIAKVVYAEGNNQDMIGKRLIVDTILNRVDNERFPNSVSKVIYQEHQFVKATSYTEECMMAVEMEMYERLDYDIYWFASTSFQPYGTPAYQHGDHYFSWEEL